MEENPMSRREFLRKAAGTVGAVVAGGAIAFGANEIAKEIKRERTENFRHAEVTVVRKEEFDSAFPLVIRREIVVLLNGKEETFPVSDEEFNSLNIGDKIAIDYEAGRGGPENIQFVNK